MSPEAIAVLKKELKGRQRLECAQDILNRAWGRPGQPLELDTPDGGPLEIILRHAHDRTSDSKAP
jgi:hypothetical protein